MKTKYQTLSGFLLSPFNKKADLKKDTDYSTKYIAFSNSNKIRLYSMCIVEDSYYLHIKVPSESQKNGNYEYDVVIRFFTEDPEVIRNSNLNNYYIQFFSNSPSFMYQYAYLYNEGGYLISALYDKLDADYINVAPEKTNSDMVISYDKSIYFACRFLIDHPRYLNKTGPLLLKEKDDKKFFQDITDFKSIKFDSSVLAEEKKLSKLLDNKSSKNRKEKSKSLGKKVSTNNTSKDNKKSINVTVKKRAGNKNSKKKPIAKKH